MAGLVPCLAHDPPATLSSVAGPSLSPARGHPSFAVYVPHPWVSVDELRQWIEKRLLHSAVSLPTYLLGRGSISLRPFPDQVCRVICLPGDVRNHMSAPDLDRWTEMLGFSSILLLVLRSDSRECVLESSEQARIAEYLSERSVSHAQRMMEMRGFRCADEPLPPDGFPFSGFNSSDGTQQASNEMWRGCGLRPWRDMQEGFKEGHILYAPPPMENDTMQHGVAMVAEVCCSVSNRSGITYNSVCSCSHTSLSPLVLHR